jgi:hypothetical protein
MADTRILLREFLRAPMKGMGALSFFGQWCPCPANLTSSDRLTVVGGLADYVVGGIRRVFYVTG